jgi:hypothetical protein
MINMSHIHDMNEDGVIHPDIIKDLKENKNFTYIAPIFFAACKSGDLDLVKYCLTSTNLSSPTKRNEIMTNALSSALNNKRLNIVSYFIFDMNMPYNGIVEEAINDYETIAPLISVLTNKNNGKSSIIPVRNMFKVRDANEVLEKELPINEYTPSQKNKL